MLINLRHLMLEWLSVQIRHGLSTSHLPNITSIPLIIVTVETKVCYVCLYCHLPELFIWIHYMKQNMLWVMNRRLQNVRRLKNAWLGILRTKLILRWHLGDIRSRILCLWHARNVWVNLCQLIHRSLPFFMATRHSCHWIILIVYHRIWLFVILRLGLLYIRRICLHSKCICLKKLL